MVAHPLRRGTEPRLTGLSSGVSFASGTLIMPPPTGPEPGFLNQALLGSNPTGGTKPS
jgi:hypothetical protein